MEADRLAVVEADPVALLRTLPALVNADEWLTHRGRFVNADFAIDIGERRFFVSIEKGRVVSLDDEPRLTPSFAFLLAASTGSWARFWWKVPPPEFHDLFAMAHRRDFRIDGSLHVFMANLTYFKDVMAKPREASDRP